LEERRRAMKNWVKLLTMTIVGDVVDAYCNPEMGICCDCGEEKPILPDQEPTIICRDCFQKRVSRRFNKDIAEAIMKPTKP
jgi:hypothetical protein